MNTVNGVSIKNKLAHCDDESAPNFGVEYFPSAEAPPIAYVHFKFCHHDECDKRICVEFENEVINFFKNEALALFHSTRATKHVYESLTFIPYFDAIDLDDEHKSNLCKIPMHYTISHQVREHNEK